MSRRNFKGLSVCTVTKVYPKEWLLKYLKRMPDNQAYKVLY